MLKFLTTTTALLAAAPALAALATPDEAREATIRVMQEDPAYFEQLKSEIATGLTPDDLTCADPAACAPGELMLTPGGVAVRLAEGGSIYPVSRTEAGPQAVLAQSETLAVEKLPDETAEPLTPIEQAITPSAPADETPIAAPAPETEPAPDAPLSATAEPQLLPGPPLVPSGQAVAGDNAVSAEVASDEPLRTLEAPPLSDYKVPEDIAGEMRAAPLIPDQAGADMAAGEQAADDAAQAAAVEKIITDTPAGDAPALEGVATVAQAPEQRRAPSEEEMSRLLEAQAALDEGESPALTDEPAIAEPGAQGPGTPLEQAVTPADPTAEAGGASDLTPVEVSSGPESAPADPNPPAAVVEALADEEAAEVETVSVSEADARSSSEDFGNRVSAQRDDSNLAENALFGLAGFALGQSLNDRSVVTLNTGDRVVITTPEGEQRVIKDQDAILVQPGYQVSTETFPDGSTRRTVVRPDGSRVVTVRDADLRVLYRRVVEANGTQIVLIDQTAGAQPVDIGRLPPPVAPTAVTPMNEDELRRALLTVAPVNRTFSLDQVLTIYQVRDLAAPVAVPNITFATGSAAIPPESARSLRELGSVIRAMTDADPRELFLIEGHTDTVGNDAANLALSDRRAESLAKALVEYFDVPAENLIIQGYGERFLLVPQDGDIRENRRASVRRITDLVITR